MLPSLDLLEGAQLACELGPTLCGPSLFPLDVPCLVGRGP